MSVVTVHHGDSRDVLRTVADASIDACVCDPPYALVSIGKRFGKPGSAPAKSEGASGVYKRASAGFMGQQWDTGETAFAVEFWAEVYRVLKPGAHVIAFSGTRTYHRLACAIEDAGFEIRDMVAWLYGSGFPKSHDVSKGIDKRGPPGQAPFAEFAAHYEERRKSAGLAHAKICAAGGWHGAVNHGGSSVNWANGYGMPTPEQWAILQPLLGLDERWKERVERVEYERQIVGQKAATLLAVAPGRVNDRSATTLDVTASGSDAAAQWEGWGTALKPALEPIVFARKRLAGTVAANVLEHGTGAINVNGCRIGSDPLVIKGGGGGGDTGWGKKHEINAERIGRFPANVVHDGSDEVVAAFPSEAGGNDRRVGISPGARPGGFGNVGAGKGESAPNGTLYGDAGSAARFFYSAKADGDDRHGSKHPTVKPVDLMAWLCRLVTPPGGTILDPFAGSGSTGLAALREGFDCILVEREAEYVADINRRIAWAKGDGRLTVLERARDINPADAAGADLPLFATQDTAQPASQPASVSSTASSPATAHRADGDDEVVAA